MASPVMADDGATPAKKRKITHQKYLDTYKQTWPVLGRSLKGESYVHCSVCDVDFSCAHGGKNDCLRHVKTKCHTDFLKIKRNHRSMDIFCQKSDDNNDTMSRSVTRAEVIMCELIAELNLPLSTANSLTKNFKVMFPDSKIAQEMKCCRNKATSMIHELSKLTQGTLSERMAKGPFSISTDGSNDEVSKQFPLVVRTVDSSSGLVNSELLSIKICVDRATGENIFSLMNNEMESYGIPWKNCLSMGCDNASVMTGHKKGVVAFVNDKQPELFLAGCTLHLVHIGAQKGAAALPPIDEVLTDIYYYFNKSDNRKKEFKGSQEMFDIDQKKNLKHVCTRWLSIARCLQRLLHNWQALKSYFKTQYELIKIKSAKSQAKSSVTKASGSSTTPKSAKSQAKSIVTKASDSSIPKTTKSSVNVKNKVDSSVADVSSKPKEPSYADKKVESVHSFLSSPTNKLYVLFLNYTVHVYDEVLVNLQSKEPMIHLLRRALISLLRQILQRFVKPVAFAGGKSVSEVEYKVQYNQKSDTDLVIGEDALKFISDKEKNGLRAERVKEFYVNVRKYFVNVCDYLLQKLPFKDPLLSHADVRLQLTVSSSSIYYFLERFSILLPQGTTKNVIIEEFANYQSYDIQSIVSECKRADEIWSKLGQMKNEDDKLMFGNLAQVILGILCIPHSSAHCERIFSTVRKNRTDQRASLSDTTLESLLVVKSQNGDPSDECIKHSNKSLDILKKAYYNSLK